MDAALVALFLLIALTPAVLVVGTPLFTGLIGIVTALALAIVALALGNGESAHLRRSFRPLAFVAVFPAVWMLVQIVPLKKLAWAHPIWQSAENALGHPLVGSLSADRGLTLLALFHYALAVAIVFVAAAVAIDRQRAKHLLYALTTATAVIAVVLVIQQLGGLNLLSKLDQKTVHDAAIDCTALGVIISAATAVSAVDPYERRQTKADAQKSLRFVLAASLAAFAICALTLIFFGTIQAVFATACGLATLLAIVVSRRVGIGTWGTAAVALAVIAAAVVSMIATEPRVLTFDLTLAFASASGPQSLVPITQQMLNDGKWAGSGAGTFEILVPIYRDIDDSVAGGTAPTAAAAMAVELGRTAVWFAVIAALVALLVLLRGALSRGRDSFYPAAAVGCLVTTALLAFCSAGTLAISTSIIVAATLGIGIVQSKSRTAH